MELSDSLSVQEIQNRIKSDQENGCCFDCGVSQPTWASVNNGVMLCQECSLLHRDNLAGSVSKVRSVKSDVWSEEQVRLMELGGNTKLRTFLQRYDLETIKDIKVKYATKAVAYYREMLQLRAKNHEINHLAPSFDDGRVLLDGRRLDYDNNVLEILPTEENISDLQSVLEANNILDTERSKADLHDIDLFIDLEKDNGENKAKQPLQDQQEESKVSEQPKKEEDIPQTEVKNPFVPGTEPQSE